MPLLNATDLGHAYGADELFHEVNVSIEVRDRIGLVGPNGVGKTTFLLVLAELLEPTSGSITRRSGLRLGYLRQEAALTFAGRDNTIWEEMRSVFADLVAQDEALMALEQALADGDDSDEAISAYSRALEQFEFDGGFTYRNDILRVLDGLGFPREEVDTPLAHLSGGQKTRVLLARLLLEKPDLLILDEPTNHLDMAAVEWLEGTLRRWDGALLIVSHDRYFLDRIVNRVWDMMPVPGEPAVVTDYKGNYTHFVRQRDEAMERAQRLYEEERTRLEGEAEFVQRHIAGGQTDLAKGRLRQLTRDLALIDQFGIVRFAELRRSGTSWMEVGERGRTLSINDAIRQIRGLRPPLGRPPRLAIRLETADESERTVWRTRSATIGHTTPLFRIATPLKIERGNRVGLLGPNGSGKSTLLKTILREVEPLEGEVELGGGVIVGYFAQAHEQLDLDRRVIDELLARRDMLTSEARAYLAHYLFRGDDVFRPVRELSGGERGRLALALLGAEGANFLLLDEPTNHLDIPSQETLQEVLEAYEGTILLVTHDRYLVSRLATHIWTIENDRLVVTEGDYEAYVRRRDREAEQAGATSQDAFAVSTATAEVVALLSDDTWFGRGPREDAEASAANPSRPREKRRRRELEEAILDAEDWLARVKETMEEVDDQDEDSRADLLAERAAAEEELAELLKALEALD